MGIFRHAPAQPYQYALTRQPTAGAMAYAFERPSGLPLFSLIGPGQAQRREFRVTQLPQIMQQLMVPVAGLGGTVAGTIYPAPLTQF